MTSSGFLQGPDVLERANDLACQVRRWLLASICQWLVQKRCRYHAAAQVRLMDHVLQDLRRVVKLGHLGAVGGRISTVGWPVSRNVSILPRC